MKLDRALVTIFLTVVGLHTGIILWIILESTSQPLVTPAPRPLVVKTITLQPPKKAPTAQVSAIKKTVVEAVKPVKEVLKKEAIVEAAKPVKEAPKKEAKVEAAKPAKEASKKEAIVKKTVKAKTTKKSVPAQKVENTLLAAAKEALSQLKQTPMLDPVTTLALSEEVPTKLTASSYEQDLAQRLHTLVRLPEYGQVTLQLTLNRNGTVEKFEVTSAESQINRDYIQQQLPKLRFVTFGTRYPGEEKHTFLLVLKNE